MITHLSELKNKLDFIERELVDKVGEIEGKNERWCKFEERVTAIKNTKPEEVININVGGKKFATTLQTLTNVKDNLFHKIILSKRLNLQNGIFIDRNPRMFPHILQYFRTQNINIRRFTPEDLAELKEEAIYYEVLPLENLLTTSTQNIKYTKLEVSAYYYDSYGLVGSMDPEVLLDTNLNTGVCTNSPGWIILELSALSEFTEIEIGGYIGRTDWAYDNGYGAGGKIETSTDKSSWNQVGTIPDGFGKTIKKVSCTKSTAKYVKLSGQSWLGIGYFKITS